MDPAPSRPAAKRTSLLLQNFLESCRWFMLMCRSRGMKQRTRNCSSSCILTSPSSEKIGST